jgi:hypothetical protein
MTTMIRSSLFLASMLLLSAGISCKKEEPVCTAKIIVIRPNGNTVSGAQVTLTSYFGLTSDQKELADYLPAKQLTDGNGEATFEFKYPSILDIEVTQISYGSGTDLIKLELGETVVKYVTIE